MANEDCTVRIEENGCEQGEEHCLKIENEEPEMKIENEKLDVNIQNERSEVKIHVEEPEVNIKNEESEAKIQNDESEANSAPTDESDPNLLSGKQKQSITKVTVLLHPVGNAPIMKRKRWIVDSNHTVARVSVSWRKMLHLSTDQSLFLYINQAFSPALDTPISALFECFGVEGVLHFHYSTMQAWG